MTSHYITPVDPAELAARISNEDQLEPLGEEMDPALKEHQLDLIQEVFDRLPPREADLIELYYFKGKKQTDIARIFNLTQAAISYRLKRAISRIHFLIEMPVVTTEDLYDQLLDILPEEIDTYDPYDEEVRVWQA